MEKLNMLPSSFVAEVPDHITQKLPSLDAGHMPVDGMSMFDPYQGMGQGMQMGMPPGMQMGMPPGMQMGMPPGMQMGMPPGMQMGMPPGMQMGMPPGMQMGMPPMPPGMPSMGMPMMGGGNEDEFRFVKDSKNKNDFFF
jgi:hypothetical protein